jgi:UDP-N-acetylmuramoyl-tripeptide--D-alanyl-D-alanine ligase
VADAVGGALEGPDVEITGATIDSRLARAGELFVPVIGRVDGHAFIAAAVAAGASAYLSGKPAPPNVPATGIVVDDTVTALADLGRAARRRLPDRVVGVTGSTGKTSTKDLLGGLLAARWRCAVSERSHNNELGVPLTLVNAPDDAEVTVVELGARGVGHISYLCDIARPTIGVVINVTLAHTEMLGSLDGVAGAKSELVRSLPPSGVAVLNADDERVAAMAEVTRARVLTFGVRGGDVRVTGLSLDDDLRPSFRLVTPSGDVDVRLEVAGAHQAQNAAAAAAAALALDMPLDDIAAGLARGRLSPWRMELTRTPTGGIVINDAYNANPASTEAALRALAAVGAERRTAVLGPMLELGPQADAEHRRIAGLCMELGIDRLVTVGAPAYGAEDVDGVEAAASLIGVVEPGQAVLVKGSRAAGLEALASRLVQGPERPRRADSPGPERPRRADSPGPERPRRADSPGLDARGARW